MMALRANALARGRSGIRVSTVETLLAMLAADVQGGRVPAEVLTDIGRRLASSIREGGERLLQARRNLFSDGAGA